MVDNADEVDDFLMHFGVKGMRWGVSRGPDDKATRINDRMARKKVKIEKREAAEKHRKDTVAKDDASIIRSRNALVKGRKDYDRAVDTFRDQKIIAKGERKKTGDKTAYKLAMRSARRTLNEASNKSIAVSLKNQSNADRLTSKEAADKFLSDLGGALMSDLNRALR